MGVHNDAKTTGAPSQRRLCVLVTEDRFIIASRIAQVLHGAGYEVLGPCPTLREGRALARREAGNIGAAVLDIDLQGEAVYPLATTLREGGVPVLFLTGYGAPAIPEAWRGVPRVEKPFAPAALVEALGRLVAGGTAGPDGGDRARYAGEPPVAVRDVWETIRRQRDLISESRVRMARASRGAKPGGG